MCHLFNRSQEENQGKEVMEDEDQASQRPEQTRGGQCQQRTHRSTAQPKASSSSAQWISQLSDPMLWDAINEDACADCGLAAFHNGRTKYQAPTRDVR